MGTTINDNNLNDKQIMKDAIVKYARKKELTYVDALECVAKIVGVDALRFRLMLQGLITTPADVKGKLLNL